jgi:hypothetical protein
MSRERRRFLPDEEPTAEPGRYGCPMLARTRLYDVTQTALPKWRCSLGWNVHSEHDVACCLATESVNDCWKAHPERLAVANVTTLVTGEHKASAD